MTTRAEVVEFARTLKGTGYHHQGRVPGVGLDCLGVEIVTAWHFAMKPRTFDIVGYKRHADGVTLLRLCREHLTEVTKEAMGFGDVVVTAVENIPHHLGILVPYRHGGFSIVHATPERGVIETRLVLSIMQFAAAFSLPGVE